MRLEGWHAMLFMAMLLVVAVVVVAVTLLVRWTLRRAWRKDNGTGPASL